MDNQDYLDQISADVRPVKQGLLAKLWGSLYFKIGVGVVAVLVVLMIVLSMLGGGKNALQEQGVELRLHLDGTAEVISEYQPLVKSSTLRSSSASLYSVLVNTSRDLNNYLAEKYPKGEEELKEAIYVNAENYKLAMLDWMFEAKVNGRLDRMYALQMAYEIEMIQAEEESLSNAMKDAGLQEILASSWNSLNNLYSEFNDFSEAK